TFLKRKEKFAEAAAVDEEGGGHTGSTGESHTRLSTPLCSVTSHREGSEQSPTSLVAVMSAAPASFEVPPSSREIKVYYRGVKELPQGEPLTLKYTEWCLDEATGVCVCFLSNPKKLNPFTFNLLWEVLFCVEHAERDPRVKVLIWAGRGRCFSGGADFTSLFAIDIDPEITAGYRRV
ncbi:hypothetical protein FOZ63_013780, partial [Perkinsus olseni]